HIDTLPEEIAWGLPKRMLVALGMIQRGTPAETVVRTEELAVEKGGGRETEGEGVVVKAPTAPRVTPEAKELPASAGIAASAVPGAPVLGGEPAAGSVPVPAGGGPVNPPSSPSTPVIAPEKPATPPPPQNGRGARNGEEVRKTAAGKFWLQVVAYREKAKAEGAAKEVRTLGYRPKISAGEVEGKGLWYRVTIEGFTDRKEAEKAAAAVEKKLKGVKCIVREQ
ncbi:MAG: SPOR domain-containing protein, partial [Syntrophales bacterium]|nr:SPOR domain-containing protein [Syntrophales bacterium]